MNQLYFEQKELVARFGSQVTLGQIFVQIEKDLQVVNEVVCQFKINGLALDEEAEKRLAESSLDEVQTLEVSSQRPEALLVGILGNWVQKIPSLIQRNDDLAAQIRFKGIEGQLKSLVDLIDEAQLLVDSIISIDTVFAQLSRVQSEAWKMAEKQMAQAIGEALQAFQKKDFNWLSDILEYDLGHSFQTWLELLEGLKQDVDDAKGTTP